MARTLAIDASSRNIFFLPELTPLMKSRIAKNGLSSTVASVACCAIGLVLVTWSFFSAPGKLLYIRYFESPTLFNPGWTLKWYFQGWSYQQHLGFSSLTEPSYISLISLELCALSAAFGPTIASALYPASIAIFSYFVFLWYARSKFREIPFGILCVGAVFFVGNAFSTAFVHEGYSVMLIEWALIPLCLRIIDIADERNETLVLIIPFIFIAAGMCEYPEIVIDWVFILALRFRTLTSLGARNRWLLPAFVAALAVNAYWAFPLLFNILAHKVVPILSETAADVAAQTQYSSITNVVLLRSFPAMWTSVFGAPECTSCSFYSSAYYELSMIALAIFAVWGLWKKRELAMAVALVIALILGTGYHYQDELLALPYQILMGLPLFDVLRGFSLFLSVAVFCYAYGICAGFDELWREWTLSRERGAPDRRRIVATAAMFAAVAIACTPWLTGSWIERGTVQTKPRGAISFPNFPVSFPAAYSSARSQIANLVRADDSVTFIAPRMPYAWYTWGAFGNDFLPYYIGSPTLTEQYWPQPNARVQGYLDTLYSSSDRFEISAMLSTMRVGAVFVHDDVWSFAVTPVTSTLFGTLVWRDGKLDLVKPQLPPANMMQLSSAPIFIDPNADRLTIPPGFRRSTIDLDFAKSGETCAATDFSIGFPVTHVTRSFPNALAVPGYCSYLGTIEIRLADDSPIALLERGPNHGYVRIPMTRSRDGAVYVWKAHAHVHTSQVFFVTTPGRPVRLFGVELRANPAPAAPDRPVPFGPVLGIAQVVPYRPGDRELVLNQSFDPAWSAFESCGGRPRLLQHEYANGYANGFRLGTCGSVLLLNVAQGVFALGILISLAALATTAFFWSRAIRRSRERATQAPS